MIRSGKVLRRWLVLAVMPILAWLLCGCAAIMNPSSTQVYGVGPASKETGVVIFLDQGNDPIPKSRKIWRSQGEDHVRWENRSDVARTITFQPGIWPFQEDQIAIIVPAKGKSDWFTIGSKLGIRQYTYHVEPPVKDGGPPGDPDISGGD